MFKNITLKDVTGKNITKLFNYQLSSIPAPFYPYNRTNSSSVTHTTGGRRRGRGGEGGGGEGGRGGSLKLYYCSAIVLSQYNGNQFFSSFYLSIYLSLFLSFSLNPFMSIYFILLSSAFLFRHFRTKHSYSYSYFLWW